MSAVFSGLVVNAGVLLDSEVLLFGERFVSFRHRTEIYVPDVYSHTDYVNHLGESRTSVGTAIMIAHIFGCSKIILLGIDGRRQGGYRYFWQMSNAYPIPFRNDGIPSDSHRKRRLRGEVTDYDLVDIGRSWDAFGAEVNKKCKVYNASPNSLVSVFPKINFEESIDV